MINKLMIKQKLSFIAQLALSVGVSVDPQNINMRTSGTVHFFSSLWFTWFTQAQYLHFQVGNALRNTTISNIGQKLCYRVWAQSGALGDAMLFLRELKRVFKRSFGESMIKRDRGHKCQLKRKITKETFRDIWLLRQGLRQSL